MGFWNICFLLVLRVLHQYGATCDQKIIKNGNFAKKTLGRMKMTEIFAAVDLAGVATFVAGSGVLIVGIALAFKGIGLSKRAVGQA
jgi:hypothetical protein